ncbi:uncharacterized protein [Procambarus clarkii]|uniref:uncharacterized protein n=1 Tax=Procambarus clarkii TaxID=6728 RepID=UPI0037428204
MPKHDPTLESAKETLLWLQMASLLTTFLIALTAMRMLRRQVHHQMGEWEHHRTVLAALKMRTLVISARRNFAYGGAYLPKALIDSPRSSLYSSLENDYENPDYVDMVMDLKGGNPQDARRRSGAPRRSGCDSQMSDPYEEVPVVPHISGGDGTPEACEEKVGTPDQPGDIY